MALMAGISKRADAGSALAWGLLPAEHCCGQIPLHKACEANCRTTYKGSYPSLYELVHTQQVHMSKSTRGQLLLLAAGHNLPDDSKLNALGQTRNESPFKLAAEQRSAGSPGSTLASARTRAIPDKPAVELPPELLLLKSMFGECVFSLRVARQFAVGRQCNRGQLVMSSWGA